MARSIRRWTAPGLLVSMLAAHGVLHAPPVEAAINWGGCEGGGGQYYCAVSVSGTSGAHTSEWSIRINGSLPSPAYGDLVYGVCREGDQLVATITVTDSGTGAIDQRTVTATCQGGIEPYEPY
jgi:hypothetical protein